MNNLLDLIVSFSKTNGCTFVRIKDYTNAQGEVQDVTINVGVSYENAKAKDIETLKTLDVSALNHNYEGIDNILLEEAREELLAAAIKPNKAMSNGQKDAYTHLVKGIKVHNETKELYVYGTKVNGTKVVKTEGEYKEDTRRPLTIAKDIIRKELRTPNYRQYKVSELKAVNANGATLELN